MKSTHAGSLVASLVLAAHAAVVLAQQGAEPPPLPFHAAEGCGGVFATHCAYLVNGGTPGSVAGLPSVGGIFVHLGHGRSLTSLTLTETLGGRLELGYGYNRFDMGDLPDDILAAAGARLRDDAVDLHHVNARLLLLSEGQFGAKWLPAVTLGAHYKDNATIRDVDADTAGTLTQIGIEDDSGVDYTLYFAKMITALPRPLLLNAGVRWTEAAHLGLLGFTDDARLVFEGSVAALLTDRLILAGEYRQKPNEYVAVPGLIEKEDDWWTLCLGYIINSHLTVSAGYAHFGHVLNHEANKSIGLAVKAEL